MLKIVEWTTKAGLFSENHGKSDFGKNYTA
jgi:hypothetical protein